MKFRERLDITDECKEKSRERVMADLRCAMLFNSPFTDAAEVIEDWLQEIVHETISLRNEAATKQLEIIRLQREVRDLEGRIANALC